ncbi:Phosphopentomutase [Luteitalea pratensis]|uniref:Phosphopentomutase n=1 Tax=Luteitalea pratensis TaxID=1855912 RepID=A0A143PRG4_LUTPR|nr:phosphopentomutase [Luteitalea pratensis]AMY11185.1 Phosphopentomutase [Luteitalea pratensis]
MGVRFERIVTIVLDSVGIGELPDASRYGDEGSDTLGNIARRVTLHLPALRHLGLDRLVPALGHSGGVPAGAWGRMAEASAGKDSVTGHWEMAGIVLERAFPTFPDGFPPEVMDAFTRGIGRPAIGNVVASGTEVIERFGAEHLRTGAPIVYTSADSVFQIAAHEGVVPVPELYRWCEVAYEIVGKGMGVGRVIARPFVGELGAFERTSNRHDYALEPPVPTVLDHLTDAGHPVVAIGKIKDLFAGRGVTRHLATASDDEGMDRVEEAMRDVPRGLIWANLVDFDALYGHRNNVGGYARNLERFDARLADLLPQLRRTDLLVVTADHGNDPTTPSTDHSREYVPLLAVGALVAAGVSLGTRETFADLGQTMADNFGVAPLPRGTSFLEALGSSSLVRPTA